jgi:hypothetical protein
MPRRDHRSGGVYLLAAPLPAAWVTAVELNPLMIRFVRHYGPRGNISTGRRSDSERRPHFISRTDRKFDIILLGFVDSWASVASGGVSLSENYLPDDAFAPTTITSRTTACS